MLFIFIIVSCQYNFYKIKKLHIIFVEKSFGVQPVQ